MNIEMEKPIPKWRRKINRFTPWHIFFGLLLLVSEFAWQNQTVHEWCGEVDRLRQSIRFTDKNTDLEIISIRVDLLE